VASVFAAAHADNGTWLPVTRSISAAFSQDGLDPLSQRFTVGWLTPTASANAFCVKPLDLRYCASVIMSNKYAQRMNWSIRSPNIYPHTGMVEIVPI